MVSDAPGVDGLLPISGVALRPTARSSSTPEGDTLVASGMSESSSDKGRSSASPAGTSRRTASSDLAAAASRSSSALALSEEHGDGELVLLAGELRKVGRLESALGVVLSVGRER